MFKIKYAFATTTHVTSKRHKEGQLGLCAGLTRKVVNRSKLLDYFIITRLKYNL